MTWQYPTDQRDNLGAYAALVGDFWTQLFGGAANVVDLLRAGRLAERQHVLQLQELQDAVGLPGCPVYHTQNWYALTLAQSRELPGRPLAYGDGVSVYGPQPSGGVTYAYGGGTDASAAYPLPAEVRDGAYVASAVTAPAVTWSRGVDFDLDARNGHIRFARSLFAEPALTPDPVLDAAGNVVDQTVTVWLFKARLDWGYLYQQFGYVVGVGGDLPSSDAYHDLLGAVWDAVAGGCTYDAVARVVAALSDVPLAAADGEVVRAVAADARHTLVITDRQAYRFAPRATTLVTPGQVLRRNDPLIDAVQVIEPSAGTLPPLVRQLSLGLGFLLTNLGGELVWRNVSVPLQVQTGVSGFTKLSWPLGGFPQDVTTFFDDLHARGVAAGATLANYLDTRTAPVGQPDATALPTTINPLRFLAQNVLRANGLIVYLRVRQFGERALGTGLAWVLRKVLPPHAAVIVYADLDQAPETVTMNGPGGTLTAGYQEAYSLFSVPG